SHEARAFEDIHSLRGDELPGNGIVAYGPGDQPKLGILSLPRRSLAAGLATKALDLVVVGRPVLALERNRRLRTELRRTLHRERLHFGPHGGGGDRRRHIDAGLCLRPVSVRRVGTVSLALGNDLGGDLLSDFDAVRLGLT